MERKEIKRIVSDVKYVAFDGTQFSYESDCKKYEKEHISLKKVYNSEIKHVSIFNDNYNFSEYKNMYYFSNEDDYFYFLNKNKIEKPYKNFDTFSPGWFIVVYEWISTIGNVWTFLDYEKYKTQQKKELDEWINKTDSLIFDKEKELNQ